MTASGDSGIYAVWLYVDGQPYGVANTTPVSPYQYVIPWDTSTVPQGDHTLTALAIDWSTLFVPQTSAPVRVDVGPAYPTVHLTSPLPWMFVRGSTPIAVTSTSAVGPATVSFKLDGMPIASPWNTTTATDGSHTLEATVGDDRSKTGSDSETVVVDNTAPTTSVTAPSANAFATSLLAATANASDAFGIQGVRFAIDGVPVGAQIVQSDAPGGFGYSATLDISNLASGGHTLTGIASDGAGNKSTSAGVTFNVGGAPPGVTVTLPLDWSFAHKTVPGGGDRHGRQGAVLGQAPRRRSRCGVVGHQCAVHIPVGYDEGRRRQPYRRRLGDGQPQSHGDVRDPARDRRQCSAECGHVPAAGEHAYQRADVAPGSGVGRLRNQVGSVHRRRRPLSARSYRRPTRGQLYLYTITYDTSPLAAGAHAVSAIVTDNAGNTTTPAPVTILTGPIQYLPVLNYHSIAPPDGYSIYDQTLAEADQQLAYLKANGYQAVTLEQYQQWLAGANIGVAKPVLITVDDALNDQKAWDGLLQKYGMKAVHVRHHRLRGQHDARRQRPEQHDLDDDQPARCERPLADLRSMPASYGHGDSYAAGAAITLNSTQKLTCRPRAHTSTRAWARSRRRRPRARVGTGERRR